VEQIPVNTSSVFEYRVQDGVNYSLIVNIGGFTFDV